MFDQALLQHLSYAGSLIHSGKTQEAANELKNYLSTGAGKSEIGFVMGEILIVDRRFAEAGQVYAEILNSDPDFPELQQRLSLAYA
jgi:predicted Zn-dependent protease